MQDKVEEELNCLRDWSLPDLLELMEGLSALIQSQDDATPRRSVLEFEGIDQESWKGVDIEKYLKEERDSWDSGR